ncbi:MAG: hypothetical protein N3A61_04820 [Ignavibacteria bacterium]|nr:hypothetical protein [Ignavibacteria bacterium]
MPLFLKTAEILARSDFSTPVFACCIGPFSLASRLFGLTEILTSILIEPDIIHSLLQKCCEFNLIYFHELKRTGVNGIVIAEPSSGMLSPELCDEFSSKYIKRIVDELQNDKLIIILHNCGNTEPLLESMQNTGAKGFHFGNKCKIQKALSIINNDRIIMGNVDPANVFRLASPMEVKKSTLDLLESTAQFNNFILSSGCDVPFQTPVENVEAFFEALKEFNQVYN